MTDQEALLDAVVARERRAVGRACRLLEEAVPGFRAALYRRSAAAGARPWIVGITGTPGVGKSSLTARLLDTARTDHERVAVIAVDPSSPFSGGAILGDRIRMQRHAADDGVFIRSLANRGALGGVARSVGDLLEVFALWGASLVMVETVGVGQAEHDIMMVADTTLVVLAPELGDELQANKAGIMEIADVFVVNKADLPGAQRMVAALQGAITLGRQPVASATQHHGHPLRPATAPVSVDDEHFVPVVLSCSASLGQGVEQVYAALDQHQRWLHGPAGSTRSAQRRLRAARRSIESALVDTVLTNAALELDEQSARLARGETDPDTAVQVLLTQVARRLGEG